VQLRYKKEESLIDLNIVEEYRVGINIKLYRLTNYGIEIIKNITNEGLQN
jgi:predicted transcriptional regulator with HTH domain